jgi:LDH2 family malate/lactate/ureidoglycolate dehydrogenase
LATKPSQGSQGVLYPGELEYRRAQERERDGVDVEDTTWRKLAELAREYGLSTKLDLPA